MEKFIPCTWFLSMLLEHKMEGYGADEEPVAFKAPQTSSYTKKKEPKGKKPEAKSRYKKQHLVSKNHPQSKIKATKVCLSQKRPLNHKLAILRKEISLESLVKKDPQLSSVKSASHSEHVFSASIIVHSESTLGHDASIDSTVKADPSKSAPKDLLS
ncbi:hypothetical protein Tco_0581412 [Tanacetum coccineum]